MTLNPDEIVTVELDCPGWTTPYARDITRRQLGELLLQLDDMADAEPALPQWPTPEQAYLNAPSLTSESEWAQRTANESPEELDRDWYLRHAALLDRIALREETDGPAGAATEEAEATGIVLQDLDDSWAVCAPRHYVRQQYALWAADQP
ncbi:hypothetical protein [Streptomyces angustmyceticus]|uniref:hypothetical protein n=1 Tax=Streptomyces angustmyceticus TaxID=285578 RepID=UPI00344B27F8